MTITGFLISKVVISSGIAVLAEVVWKRAYRVELAYAIWTAALLVLIVPSVVVVSVPKWISTNLELFCNVWSNRSNTEMLFGESRNESALFYGSSFAEITFGAAAMTWFLGSGFVFWRHVKHVRLVERLVRFAPPASPTVLEQCSRIANELGVRKCPAVVTANGTFSPFLWHPVSKRPSVVIPIRLLERLSSESVDAVLRHELVHLRRCDAWRHRLELLVLSLWWWLPTTWIAHRRLHELEELCTDAEVLRTNPKGIKAYGHALLDTEEFLSGSHPAICGFVLAFATCKSLKARIAAISVYHPMHVTKRSQVLTYGLVAACFVPGLLTLGSFSNSQIELRHGAFAEWVNTHGEESRQHDFVGQPNPTSVTVCHLDDEILLTWPSDESTDGMRMIRLVRLSDTNAEPRLWKMDEQRDGSRGLEQIHRGELDWIFAFLSVDNVIIDQDGTQHKHPDLLGASDVQHKERELCTENAAV